MEDALAVEGASIGNSMSKPVFIQIASPSERNPAGVTCEGFYERDGDDVALLSAKRPGMSRIV
jgi:hypothetical protein